MDPPHDPHRVHHVVGPLIAMVGTLLAAGAGYVYSNSITSGETSTWAVIASLLFVPVVTASVFVLSFLLSRALGRLHTIGSLVGLAVGVGMMVLWTILWVGVFRSSPAEILKHKLTSATSVANCAALESDQAYWRDCMIDHLKTEQDYAHCLSQADQFVRPLDTTESATASCGVVYSHVKKDISICQRLLLTDDQNACAEQYAQPLMKSTGG